MGNTASFQSLSQVDSNGDIKSYRRKFPNKYYTLADISLTRGAIGEKKTWEIITIDYA